MTWLSAGRNHWHCIPGSSLPGRRGLWQIKAGLCCWQHRHHTRAGWCWHQVSSNWGETDSSFKCYVGSQGQFENFCKVSSCLSFGSDMTLHGLDKLPISSVGAVVFGFTTQLSYCDLTLASLLLNDPNTLFLLEAPDATCRARTAGDAVVEIPCKIFQNRIGS